MEPDRSSPAPPEMSRRDFVTTSALAGTAIVGGIMVPSAHAQTNAHGPGELEFTITINGKPQRVVADPRTTLLDLLRERLGMTGAKKGCDHGQCGACTVLVNGLRVNACLTLAVARAGDRVTTIEGLAQGEQLHPMQMAFVEHDGFQCGYCTPGQICSAVAMLEEARAGIPSAVTVKLPAGGPIHLTDSEIRERMAGNICRCGAYPNIVDAIREVSERKRS